MQPTHGSDRTERHRAEIVALVAAGHLDRAADLAHEHLVEVPGDSSVLDPLLAALTASPSARVRARVDEFSGSASDPGDS
ncbi:MAG: hypothetical protein HZB15_01670 [Actinobacteria bacterium]|nr:hypothetical protein [Actinomycetota bacterium]